MSARWLASIVVAGWIAEFLATTNAEVDKGIAAYEAGEYDQALESFERAQEKLGERPELAFDRGLVLLAQDARDEAQKSFERASESADGDIRGSAFYELGNLALDAEQWDAAIGHYIECLKARPDHANAKWNLELALQRKKREEEEKQEQEKDEPQDDQQEDDQQDEDKQEQQDEKQQEQQDEKQQEQQDEKQQEQQDEKQQEQQDEKQREQQARPVDKLDLQRALENLDQQDDFAIDRPQGGYVPPSKDW